MPDETREQLSFQFDSISYKLEQMSTDLRNLELKLNYGEYDWPEDADMMLEEMDNAVGDALDKWAVLHQQLTNYLR
jgi:hypothetical protein